MDGKGRATDNIMIERFFIVIFDEKFEFTFKELWNEIAQKISEHPENDCFIIGGIYFTKGCSQKMMIV